MSEEPQPSTTSGEQVAMTSSQQLNTTTTIPIFTSKLPTPANINLKSDLRENWKQWRQIWDVHALVTGLNQQSKEFQDATFATCIGQEALKVHNGLPFKTEEEKKDMAKIQLITVNFADMRVYVFRNYFSRSLAHCRG